MKISAGRLTLMAVLTAVSLTVFVIEAQFPVSAVGGIKLGLANIVTLIAMLFVGRREAGIVLALRIILASAFYGTFISFAFSVAGGLAAYTVMCLLINRFDRKQIWVVSVFGGVFHNFGQIAAACVITGSPAAAGLLPYLIVSGILAGFFTGICAQRLWFSPLRKFSIKSEK